MGASESKEDDDAEKYVYDTSLIFWDEFGNLRYGKAHPVSPEKQIRAIMEADEIDGDETKTWYIMDSAWTASWLAYVHYDKDNSPAPGPCRNDRLLAWDYTLNKYTARFGLFMAVRDRGGDYRRVSEKAWKKFQEFYPGSGPTITMEYGPKNQNENGLVDTSNWVIHDPPPPPEDQGKKKKKKLLKGFGSKDRSKDNLDSVDGSSEGIRSTFSSLLKPKSKDANLSSAATPKPKDKYEKLGGSRESESAEDKEDSHGVTPLLDSDGNNNNINNSDKKVDINRESYIEDVFFGKDNK